MTQSSRRSRFSLKDVGPWKHCAHIFAASGFAFAQPLYDIFARHVDFFVAHGAGPVDIVLLVFLLSIGAPLLLVMLGWLAGRVHDDIRSLVHFVVLGILAGLICLPLFKKMQSMPDLVVLGAAALAGVGFVWAYIRSPRVQEVMTYAAIATLLFPSMFLFFSPVREILFRGQDDGEALPVEIDDSLPPIIFVVFEELPLVSLLDEDRQIDAVRYPNFSRLSQNAHWFRNYTVNAPATKGSITMMLTGRYERGEISPLLPRNYPESLFVLLGSAYDIVPLGVSSRMCPKKYIEDSSRQLPSGAALQQSVAERLSNMTRDMSVVYMRLVTPSGLSDGIPPVTDSWAHFFAPDAPQAKDRKGRLHKQDLFEFYIRSIGTPSKPTLNYLHARLAHNTWHFLPSGKRYPGRLPGSQIDRQEWDLELGFGGKKWSDNEWLVTQGYQRHLLEIGAADLNLGKLIRRLEKLDIYDRSLIVVTSDHGCSFEPGSRIRGRKGTVERDTMPVPLIVKLPFQRKAVVSDENVEAIDILPTIADVLGIEMPWPVDGQSIFDTSAPRREQKTLLFPTGEYVVDAANEGKWESLRHKLEIFGSGTTRPNGYFSIGRYGQIVGTRATAIRRADASGLIIRTEGGDLLDAVDPDDPFCSVCYVSGEIGADASIEAPVHLAISVNGVIRAVTQSYREPSSSAARFYAVIPDNALREGKNTIDFFAITPDDSGRVRLASVVKER